jgi:hypothetical protein
MKTRRRLPSAFILAGLVLPILACGCHKSQREIAEENAIKRHELEVQQRKNFRPPPSLKQGIGFVINLAHKGQLPGITTNDHGSLRWEKPPEVLADGRLSLEFHMLTSRPQQRSYYYVVAVNTNNNDSELLKAWRTEGGKVVEQYPVQ